MVKQARAVATRTQIVKGAAEVFDHLGYDGSSLGEIVDAAGTTKGALYFHFKTKGELAQAIIAEQHRMSITAVEAIGARDAPAVSQLVMLCHEIGRQIVDDPIVRAGIRVTVDLSIVPAQGPRQPYLDWIEACEVLASRAIEQGDIREEVDPNMLARFVVSAFTGVQTVSNVLERRAHLERNIDEMWQLLLPGIVPARRRGKIEKIRTARWNPEAMSQTVL